MKTGFQNWIKWSLGMELNRKRDTEGPLRQGSFSAEGQGLEAYRESLSRRDFQIFMVKSHEDAFFQIHWPTLVAEEEESEPNVKEPPNPDFSNYFFKMPRMCHFIILICKLNQYHFKWNNNLLNLLISCTNCNLISIPI